MVGRHVSHFSCTFKKREREKEVDLFIFRRPKEGAYTGRQVCSEGVLYITEDASFSFKQRNTFLWKKELLFVLYKSLYIVQVTLQKRT